MTDWTTYAGTIPPYDVLTDADVQKMTEAIFELMREIGVKFEPHLKAFDLFSGAGCDISDEGIVRFPTDLVEASIESVAKSYRLWDRSGAECVVDSDQYSTFMPGMTCIYMIDPETGERRSSTKEDLAAITRVADALPEMDGVCLPCKMTERPDVLGEIEEFAVMVANTTKPLSYLCEKTLALEAAIEMASAIRGGADQLRQKPYFSHGVTPLPLQYFKDHVDQLLIAAENGIPVDVGTASVGGASTPITIAGNVIHCCATELDELLCARDLCVGPRHDYVDQVRRIRYQKHGLGLLVLLEMFELLRIQIFAHPDAPLPMTLRYRMQLQFPKGTSVLTAFQTIWSSRQSASSRSGRIFCATRSRCVYMLTRSLPS